MTNKKRLEIEMSGMMSIINQFNNNNDVVITRWTQLGYTLDMIIEEFNTIVETYNKKYGKRFGCCKKIK